VKIRINHERIESNSNKHLHNSYKHTQMKTSPVY